MQIHYSLYVGSSGYSVSAQDYLKALQFVKPDSNIKALGVKGINRKKGISEERYNWLLSLKNTPPKTDYISIQHCIPSIYVSDHSKKKIGIAIYETIDPPGSWVQRMNEMDHIITASNFNKGTFETAGVRSPITVVPHCFDPQLFHNKVYPSGRYKLFTFLYIATWKERKNFSGLINAFYEAFRAADNVCLLLKTDKPENLKTLIDGIKIGGFKTKDTAPIYIEEDVVTFEEIPKIMKKADVYISTSYGEGFSLGGLHAMALGIPLIIVRYGGCLEYAKPDLCTFINPSGYKRRLSMDGLPQFKNRIWPEIRISEIRDKMKYVYLSYKDLKEQTEKAYEHVHTHFTYGIIGRRFHSVLEQT